MNYIVRCTMYDFVKNMQQLLLVELFSFIVLNCVLCLPQLSHFYNKTPSNTIIIILIGLFVNQLTKPIACATYHSLCIAFRHCCCQRL